MISLAFAEKNLLKRGELHIAAIFTLPPLFFCLNWTIFARFF